MARLTRKPLVAGNWKMNGLRSGLAEARRIAAGAARRPLRCELWLCPPATLLMAMAATLKGSGLGMGGQDCHAKPAGAHTGDISAEMLKDAGARAVILGHSERRQHHGETDEAVRAKVSAAWRAGLAAIVCVGETESERDRGQTRDVVARQLAQSLPDGVTARNTVIAYEPVWAIGTGRTPTAEDIVAVHRGLRGDLGRRFAGAADGVRLLYGGSVKPENAAALLGLDDVDGALVGGASLLARDFLAIASVYARQPSLRKSPSPARR